MKYRILIIAFLNFFMISGCSTGDDASQLSTQYQIPQYHLTKVTGGIAGVDHTFDMDTVIWVFTANSFNQAVLIVENNNEDEGLEDGLDSGSYFFSSIVNNDEEEFLFIEDTEFGHVESLADGTLVLDQNKTTSGTASDGFVYTFKLKTVIVDTGS